MDDGKGGSYTSLVGLTSNYLKLNYQLSSGITKGNLYRFRYRAKNIIGWSDYSPVAFVLAASKPSAPPAPVYTSSTSSSILISFS
jgi:hypothetical protein